MRDYYWIFHVLIALAILGRLVLSYIQHFQAMKTQKEAKQAAEKAKVEAEKAQNIAAYLQHQAKTRQASAPPPAPKAPESTIPPHINGKVVAFHYDDIVFRPSAGSENNIQKNKPLYFAEHKGTMYLLQNNQLVGSLVENAVTGKIRSWLKSGDLVLSFVTAFPSSLSSAKISVYFYRNI